MKWMKERDLLIAQTMAFVQSVTGKKPDALVPQVSAPKPVAEAPKPVAEAPPPVVEATKPVVAEPVAEVAVVAVPIVEAALTATAVLAEKPTPAPPPRPEIPADFKSEIKARVASFRAQQERFLREREEYSSTTMAKVHASLQEIAERRQNDK